MKFSDVLIRGEYGLLFYYYLCNDTILVFISLRSEEQWLQYNFRSGSQYIPYQDSSLPEKHLNNDDHIDGNSHTKLRNVGSAMFFVCVGSLEVTEMRTVFHYPQCFSSDN